MARNKHPQETVEKILDVAQELFLRKGYDNTSIQDIIDRLGGLTKGAIYHHFKSKEDIFYAMLNRANEEMTRQLFAIRDDPHRTGAQKLQALLEASAPGSQLDIWSGAAPSSDPAKNGRLLGMEYQSILAEIAPVYIRPIIEEGVRDGSIVTEYPKELAEVLMLLGNLWASPMFYETTEDEMRRRIEYFLVIAESLGVRLESKDLADELERYRAERASKAARFSVGGADGTESPRTGVSAG